MAVEQEQAEAVVPDADRQLLASYLASRDVLCPRCGYSLRGLQADTCPECSYPIRLVVQDASVLTAWHTLGIIGLSSGLGIGFILGASIVIPSLIMGGGSHLGLPLFSLYATALICGVLLWLWCRNRSRIAFMPRTTRISMVAGCFAISALGGLAFSLAFG